VLVAWGWSDHLDHDRTVAWLASAKAKDTLFTSAIPQLGFVRVSVQRTAGRLAIKVAAQTLAGMIKSLGDRHAFVSDDEQSADGFPGWCQSAARTTDAHLLRLAQNHGLELATLDAQIPGAFLIP
jgi:predicted nucleic acid-binding protein